MAFRHCSDVILVCHHNALLSRCSC